MINVNTCQKCGVKNVQYSQKYGAYICNACGNVDSETPNPFELQQLVDFLKKLKFLHSRGMLDFLIPEKPKCKPCQPENNITKKKTTRKKTKKVSKEIK